MCSEFGPLRSNRQNVLHLFFFFPVSVKKVMDAKLCFCLVLIILGTVQGAIPRNMKKNPLEVFARQEPRECLV